MGQDFLPYLPVVFETTWLSLRTVMGPSHMTITQTKFLIAVIDDDSVDVDLLHRQLRRIEEWEIEIVYFSDPEKGKQELREREEIDFIFLDLNIGVFSGIDVLRDLREAGDIRPIVVLTGHTNEQTVAELMRCGADDYLSKGRLSSEVLRRSISNAVLQSHRRKAESELEIKNDLLAELLKRERSASSELKAAKEEAEKADKAKSEFLASMSHELRTPLNAIIGFSQGLLERVDKHPLNEHQNNRLSKILESGYHLLALINDILDIAKIEAGKTEVFLCEIDPHEMASEVASLGEALVADKPNVQFRCEIAEHLPLIHSDRGKVKQIFINLLGNAAKFTKVGSVTLRAFSEDGYIHMSVEDTGIGISEVGLENLFDRFYQVDQSHRRKHGGTGLGLSLCESFADLIGATVSVQSVEGEGSTFTLKLPIDLPGVSDDVNESIYCGEAV